ncbi:MAG: hypothetical protein ACXVCV_01800 [Polyangia bacterium]
MAAPPVDPVFGDLKHEREMRDNQIKGNLLGRRAWYVRDRWGDEALAALAKAVPEAARKFLVDAPLTFAWYPFSVMMDIDRAIVEGPMRGDVAKMTEFGSAIAKHDLPLLYKVLFKVGSPTFIVKRLNIVAKQYIRESDITVVMRGDRDAVVTLSGRRFPMYFCTYGVSGWFRAALELSGATAPTVEHTGCMHRGDAECSWTLRWR